MTTSGRTPALRVGPDQLDRLRALVRALVDDGQAVDDVLQETWIASARLPEGVREPGQVQAWLSTTARRIALGRRRAERRRAERERASARPESYRQRSAEQVEACRAVVAALGELPEPYRTAVGMRYLDGLPPREIANRLGLSSELVRQHVHRGLTRLRADLDATYGEGHEDPRAAWCAPLLPLVARRSAAAALASVGLAWKVGVAAALAALLLVPLRGGEGSASDDAAPLAPGGVSTIVDEDVRHDPAAAGDVQRVPAALAEVTEASASGEAPRDTVRLRIVAAENGMALSGVEVHARCLESEREAPAVVSDGAGSVTLAWAAACDGMLLTCRAEARLVTHVVADRRVLTGGLVVDVPLQAKARIGGQVVDERGQPVEGAELWLATEWQLLSVEGWAPGAWPAELPLPAERAWKVSSTLLEPDRAAAPALRTGVSGSFDLAAELRRSESTDTARSERGTEPLLLARHADHGLIEVRESDGRIWSELLRGEGLLVLPDAPRLHGLVLEARTGAAIAGAVVHPCPEYHELDDLSAFDVARSRTSGLDGRFEHARDTERDRMLLVRADGYADAWVALEDRDLEGELEVRLGPGTELVVQVFDDDGTPLEGVLVELEPFTEDTNVERELRTDPDGIARFERLHVGKVDVTVKSRDHLPVEALLVDAPAAPQVITLRRPVSFSGRIAPWPLGDARLEAYLLVEREGREPRRLDVADAIDAGGSFDTRGEAPRGLRAGLHIEVEGFLPWSSGAYPIDSGRVVVDAALVRR